MDFNDYINQLGQLDKQEIEVELKNFYAFNSGLLQFFKAIDNQFQSLLNASNLNSKSIETILVQTNQILPELNNLKFEVSMFESDQLSEFYKNNITKTIRYIKEQMVISEVEITKQRLLKQLSDNESKYKEEQIDKEKRIQSDIEEKNRIEREQHEQQENYRLEEEKREKERLDKIRLKRDENGLYQIHLAVKSNNIINFNELLDLKIDLNVTDNSGKTPLFYVSSFEILKGLLGNNGNVHIKDNDGNTPLHYFVVNNRPIEFINTLIQYGANVNVRNNKGKTPLFYVNNVKILSELINSGANIDIQDETGWTALHQSVIFSDKIEITEFLILHGAEINNKSKEGHFIIEDAAFSGNISAVQKLIKSGFNIKGNSYVILFYTLLPKKVSADTKHNICRVLIEAGIDVNTTDKDGYPIFATACKHGTPEIIQEFINGGLNINTKYSGIPLICFAAGEPNEPEIVNMLIKAGLNVNLHDNKGANLMLKVFKNADSIRLLKNAGASNK